MLQNIRFREAGGSVNLEGLVDTRTDQVEVMTRFVMDDIYLDSMFYVFEDFNQDWLVYRHLSGRMDAEVTAFMNFTPDLRLIPESLVSDLSLTILDGKLNNFEPMQLLAPYFPKDDLSRLEFAELRNEIHVEDEMIYIPQMKISSNVTEIEIGGTHTFDQHIDYKIVAPLFHAPRVDRDELFAAIEDDGSTSPKIHLRLTGTTDEYEVKLDRAGQKEQVISGLRKEVDELKKAFRDKRKQKQKTLQLDEEEYFDWNDNG